MKQWKDRIEGDYSNIRGVCHNPEEGKSREIIDRELDYAVRLNLNAVRFWMEQEKWEKDRSGYEKRILDFVDSCGKHGIRVMPIFWNGNFITAYEEANEKQWERKKKLCRADDSASEGKSGASDVGCLQRTSLQ